MCKLILGGYFNMQFLMVTCGVEIIKLFSVPETHIVNIWLKMLNSFVNWSFMHFVTWNFDSHMELWKDCIQFHKKNIVNLTQMFTLQYL